MADVKICDHCNTVIAGKGAKYIDVSVNIRDARHPVSVEQWLVNGDYCSKKCLVEVIEKVKF